jgi:hypothetical protein
MDLGDKTSRYCVLDDEGEVMAERSVATTKKGMLQAFGAMERCRRDVGFDPDEDLRQLIRG